MCRLFIVEKRHAGRALSGVSAFSLVEVAMALGIVAFVLVALIGLANTALRTTGESAKSIEAANTASQIVARWRSILEWNTRPETVTKTPRPAGFPLSIDVPNDGASDAKSDVLINGEGVEVTKDPKFRLDYKIEHPDDLPGMLRLHMRLAWPPQAPDTSLSRSTYELITSVRLGTS